MKFEKGDVILHLFYRQVVEVGRDVYKLKPLFNDGDYREWILVSVSYTERHYKKVHKLELLLLGLDLENDTVYNKEKEQT